MKTVTITLQMDLEFHEKLKISFSKHGLTIEEGTRLFFAETVKQGKIPFDYSAADIEEARNNPCVTVTISEDE